VGFSSFGVQRRVGEVGPDPPNNDLDGVIKEKDSRTIISRPPQSNHSRARTPAPTFISSTKRRSRPGRGERGGEGHPPERITSLVDAKTRGGGNPLSLLERREVPQGKSPLTTPDPTAAHRRPGSTCPRRNSALTRGWKSTITVIPHQLPSLSKGNIEEATGAQKGKAAQHFHTKASRKEVQRRLTILTRRHSDNWWSKKEG